MREDLKSKINSKIGERRIMKCGEEAEIVEYINNRNITVKFLETEELVKCTYGNFKVGNVKSHFVATVYGVGVVGLEKTKEKGRQLKSYEVWQNMLKRCYSEKYQQKQPTYIGCTVCEEWKYYSNFKDWYNKNYYEVDNERIALDKDILIKGNKVYSPETCIFVPENVNSLFTRNNANRGDLPIGVCWDKQGNKYRSCCRIFDINTNKYKRGGYLGLYNTPQEAFNVYKKAKEDNIKQAADYYRDRIPQKLYEAMYRYEVHIDD